MKEKFNQMQRQVSESSVGFCCTGASEAKDISAVRQKKIWLGRKFLAKMYSSIEIIRIQNWIAKTSNNAKKRIKVAYINQYLKLGLRSLHLRNDWRRVWLEKFINTRKVKASTNQRYQHSSFRVSRYTEQSAICEIYVQLARITRTTNNVMTQF